MRTYVQEGKVLSVEATDTLAAGDFVKVGELKGFAQNDAVIGQNVALVTEGVFEATVDAAADIAVGDPIYATPGSFAPELTTSADDGGDPAVAFAKIGFATEAASPIAGVATVNVKLV